MLIKKYLLAAALLLPACASQPPASPPTAPAPEKTEAPAQAEAPKAEASAPVKDEKALAVLREMSEFLAKQKSFRVHSARTLDLVLDNGQKIQADSSAIVSVQRPDRIHVERKGIKTDQHIYYDGKSLSLYRPATGHYGTLPAPATIDAMLERAIDTLGIVPPGADLLFSDSYKVLTADMKEAMYVGRALINGVPCHHLAFRSLGVDWQIWITDGKQPLPLKMSVIAPENAEDPQFVAYYSKWDLKPKFKANEFSFIPPKNAVKIGILNGDEFAAQK
jgi:hypothetical protein